MMVGFCVCEAANLDCERRMDGSTGLVSDPFVRPLVLVSCLALTTCGEF